MIINKNEKNDKTIISAVDPNSILILCACCGPLEESIVWQNGGEEPGRHRRADEDIAEQTDTWTHTEYRAHRGTHEQTQSSSSSSSSSTKRSRSMRERKGKDTDTQKEEFLALRHNRRRKRCRGRSPQSQTVRNPFVGLCVTGLDVRGLFVGIEIRCMRTCGNRTGIVSRTRRVQPRSLAAAEQP